MISHFQINREPCNYLRGGATWIQRHEIQYLFAQAAQPSIFLSTFSHTCYLSYNVYRGYYGEPRGSLKQKSK
mgnify:FL=1